LTDTHFARNILLTDEEIPVRHVPISKRDLEGLAGKLDTLTLTENERAIMLAVLGMATSSIKEIAAKSKGEKKAKQRPSQEANKAVTAALGKLPPLSTAFNSAFVAGEVSSFSINGLSDAEDSIGVSVGGPCVSVSWSMDIDEKATDGGDFA
jgi:hypothetical protein